MHHEAPQCDLPSISPFHTANNTKSTDTLINILFYMFDTLLQHSM